MEEITATRGTLSYQPTLGYPSVPLPRVLLPSVPLPRVAEVLLNTSH